MPADETPSASGVLRGRELDWARIKTEKNKHIAVRENLENFLFMQAI